MKKLVLALTLVASFALLLAGCGSSGSDNKGNGLRG